MRAGEASSRLFEKDTPLQVRMLCFYHSDLQIRLPYFLKLLIIKHKLSEVWSARCYYREYECFKLLSHARLLQRALDSTLGSTATFVSSRRQPKPASFFAAWTWITFPSRHRATTSRA